MLTYDNLVCELKDVILDDRADLPQRFKGNYLETTNHKIILISKYIDTWLEKKCILAEEIGHYHKTIGHIVDQNELENIKQEEIARRWSYEKLVTFEGIISAFHAGVSNKYELADHLDILEDFLDDALKYYKNKFGICVDIGDSYTIYFDPLRVVKYFR